MGRKLIDISNQRFGKWIVLEYIGNNKSNKGLWKCLCDCGNIENVASSNLRKGTSKQCRECYYKSNEININGHTFGKWKVLEKLSIRQNKSIVWKCQCECGYISNIPGSRLKSGKTKQCRSCLAKSKRVNIIGQKFGKLTAIKFIRMDAGHSVWLF